MRRIINNTDEDTLCAVGVALLAVLLLAAVLSLPYVWVPSGRSVPLDSTGHEVTVQAISKGGAR